MRSDLHACCLHLCNHCIWLPSHIAAKFANELCVVCRPPCVTDMSCRRSHAIDTMPVSADQKEAADAFTDIVDEGLGMGEDVTDGLGMGEDVTDGCSTPVHSTAKAPGMLRVDMSADLARSQRRERRASLSLAREGSGTPSAKRRRVSFNLCSPAASPKDARLGISQAVQRGNCRNDFAADLSNKCQAAIESSHEVCQCCSGWAFLAMLMSTTLGMRIVMLIHPLSCLAPLGLHSKV